ncbi:MAG: hypothetical protein JW894_12765 [Bacteroidales bacterium]|nr:hypothetical protein [Bacteroidales bacterium]
MRQIFISLIIGILVHQNLIADIQSYGLRFYGQEYEINKRTGLELLPDKKLELNQKFKLSFDLSFVKNYNSYFGYVFRIIVNDETNIDLIYENKFDTINTINLIMGELGPLFSIRVDKDYFFSWKEISLEVNTGEKSISLQLEDSVYIKNNLPFNKKDQLKIFFGLNNYRTIQSTDLPNMDIKNIKIFENEKLKYHWTLNQMEGEIATDRINHQKAEVVNPFWLYQMHQNWKLEETITLNGYAQLTFNPETEEIYIVSPDSLVIYSIDNASVTQKIGFNNRINIQSGMELFCDTLNDRLLCYSVDLTSVSVFDDQTRTWSTSFPEDIPVGTEYYHNINFYSPVDNSVYILGGYGQLTYKNEVYKVDLDTFNWKLIQTNTSDVFTPRYLFGMGKNAASDTVYIIGGYGSETGDQKLNPGYWYELIRYSPGAGTFERVYQFETQQPEDFCFANSLIIDEINDIFYGLTFSKYIYDGKLNLVRGSLLRPDIEILATPLPFTFHDIVSYADIFFSENNQELIATTRFQTETYEPTEIKIYSLMFPPAPGKDLSIASKPQNIKLRNRVIAGLVVLLLFALLVFRKKLIHAFGRKVEKPELKTVPASESIVDSGIESLDISQFPEEIRDQKSCITLFGGFQAIDKYGSDITSHFTPLIKELFLLILLNSLPGKRGISSQKLKEILWFDKSDKDARNNRAVNIARLKVILKKIGDIEVSKETGYWKIEINSKDVCIDFYDYHQIVNNKQLSPAQIFKLLNIVKNGALLLNLDYEWLDDYKSDVSNMIIDTLLQFAEKNINKVEPNFLIHIADVILIFDTLNEESMIIKCRVLAKLGKHSLAKNAFTKFCNEYRTLYDEDYLKNFNEIIE